MSAPQMEPSMDAWIMVNEKLTPLQNLAVLGLLFLKPNTPPSIIAVRDPVTDENIAAAEKWLRTRFRGLLDFYCENYRTTKVRLAGELLNKADFVKSLGPVMVATFSLPLGVIVSFLFAALGIGLEKWCQKYAKKEFNGKGAYDGTFPKGRVEGLFDVEYVPAIEEFVKDPETFPLKGYIVNIRVPAEITGKVKVPLPKDSDDIFFSFKENTKHSFAFRDTRLKIDISGDIKTLNQDKPSGPNILAFSTDALRGL